MCQQADAVASKDYITLQCDITVGDALDAIRNNVTNEDINYFYVLDDESRLVGVIPTRRLLTSALDKPVSKIMIRKVIKLKPTDTVLMAHEMMLRHKLLAIPLVDEQKRIAGVIDIKLFSDSSFEPDSRQQVDEVFEAIGFRISQIKDASAFRIFRFRFPWLLSTIASGTICALLASFFEVTLAKSLIIAFFLTLVLGLGESVSMQTMTVTIQALKNNRPTLPWYWNAMRRELGTGILLGAACGVAVGLITSLWHSAGMVAVAIGGSIMLVIVAACLYGLSIPSLLHALKLDPKIAAGPLTLAITDISTVLIYFGLAATLL
jgi:magnesium transporter